MRSEEFISPAEVELYAIGSRIEAAKQAAQAVRVAEVVQDVEETTYSAAMKSEYGVQASEAVRTLRATTYLEVLEVHQMYGGFPITFRNVNLGNGQDVIVKIGETSNPHSLR